MRRSTQSFALFNQVSPPLPLAIISTHVKLSTSHIAQEKILREEEAAENGVGM
jgi:hypothetical protein